MKIQDITLKLQNWLEKRYLILWNEFRDSEFKLGDAINILRERFKDDKENVLNVLSELRKSGRLNVKLVPEDNRKRIYKLISKDKIILAELSIKNGKLTRSELYGLLKKAADLIRTRVDYKFILILLFLKRVSDKWEEEYNKAYKKALEDGLNKEEAKNEAGSYIYHDFNIPEEYLWDNLREDVSKLPERFSRALKALGEKNPELKDVIDNVDFIQFTSSRENSEILRQLVELFSKRKFNRVSPDILGDAYEWILRYFAPTKAKEGEVYTPREVIRLLIEMLRPEPSNSIYDPACGSNGMLIIPYEYVKEKYGRKEADKLFLYGQEVNPRTLTLGRMNLYIHNIRNAQLMQGDTLLHPKFRENSGIKTFHIVVANPPWNHKGYNEATLKKGEFWKKRFKYGFTTKQSADWAWIQHMLASADDKKGKVGLVIDNGCLFRSGREGKIRKEVLEDNLIESVILLPEKLFYNTGAPGALIIFNKNKENDRRNKVLFINASEEYEQHPDVRKLNILSKENIRRIAAKYIKFEEEKGFSRTVSEDEIKENDYNLNVTLYVFPEEEIEDIDIDQEWRELKEVEAEINKVEEQIKKYLEEIK